MKPTQNTVQSPDEKAIPLVPPSNSPSGNDLGSVPRQTAQETARAAAESGRARVSAAVDELPGVAVVCEHSVIRELVSGMGQWVCNRCRTDVTLILGNLPHAQRIQAVVQIVVRA